jgi:hypothetical protein
MCVCGGGEHYFTRTRVSWPRETGLKSVACRKLENIGTLVRRRICGKKERREINFKEFTGTAENDMKNLRISREKQCELRKLKKCSDYLNRRKLGKYDKLQEMSPEERTHNCCTILQQGTTFCDRLTLICRCECRGLCEIQVTKHQVEELETDDTKTEMKWFGRKRKKNVPGCDGMPAEICGLFIAVKGGEGG